MNGSSYARALQANADSFRGLESFNVKAKQLERRLAEKNKWPLSKPKVAAAYSQPFLSQPRSRITRAALSQALHLNSFLHDIVLLRPTARLLTPHQPPRVTVTR